ncbi:MAG: sensor histidine kinase [Bacteroidota bacterium]
MDNIKQIILLSTLIFLLAPLSIVIYISKYSRRKKKHIEEKAQMKAAFESELLKTRFEIQEETLNHISREIHDNITQVLSFVKLNLALTGKLTEEDKAAKIKESRELIAQTIYDLRDLSKSLSFEHISAKGLVKTIEMEAERINKSGIIAVSFSVAGSIYDLGEQPELLLFRIFQESVNNTLKHANAKHVSISLQYSDQMFNLTVADDGDGFSTEVLGGKRGLGLKNIETRAALIGGTVIINSTPGNGCSIAVNLKPLNNLNPDGTHSDSFG